MGLFFKQIDASFLAVFRMGFGALLLFECINYGIFLCLDCMYFSSTMLFKYLYVEWVRPWPLWGLRVHWLMMAAAAFCIMVGYYYRLAIVFFTASFIYMFWLDETQYLNHFYMVILFSILLMFLPANRYWSLDAKRDPFIWSPTVPSWTRLILLCQLEIILIYAGLVKLNSDWLNLEPMRFWMNYKSQQHGEFLQFLTQDWGIALASYGVIALHLIGAPLLFSDRYRIRVLGAYAVFHTINAFVFNIGIFPWFTLFASLMFFSPSWPKTFWRKIQMRFPAVYHRFSWQPIRYGTVPMRAGQYGVANTLVVVAVVTWLLVQALVPWRHTILPGSVAWNEAGHRFSWRMMLRSKRGKTVFTAQSASGRRWVVDSAADLNKDQLGKMACIPDMIWQYAQHIEKQEIKAGREPVAVYVDAKCSLNARKLSVLVDPSIDLTSIPRTEPTDNWILPLNEPLQNPFFTFKGLLSYFSKERT